MCCKVVDMLVLLMQMNDISACSLACKNLLA